MALGINTVGDVAHLRPAPVQRIFRLFCFDSGLHAWFVDFLHSSQEGLKRFAVGDVALVLNDGLHQPSPRH